MLGSTDVTDPNQTLQGILGSGTLDPTEALELFRQVLDQISAAHERNKLHLSLQPRSIRLVATEDGVETEVRGFGRKRSRVALYYAAPEVNTAPHERCDVYSLGAILYEMVVGEKHAIPGGRIDALRAARHDPMSMMRLAPNVPAHVLLACLRALEPNPAGRYATAREFGQALFGDYAPTDVRERVSPTLRQLGRRLGTVAVMLVGFFVLCASAVGVSATYGVHTIDNARSLTELRSRAFSSSLAATQGPVVDSLIAAGAEPEPLTEAQTRFVEASDPSEAHAAAETLYRLIEQASGEISDEDILARRTVDDRVQPLANSRRAYDDAVDNLNRVATSATGALAHRLSMVDSWSPPSPSIPTPR